MSLLGGECHMIGWIIVIVIAVVAVGYYMYVSDEIQNSVSERKITSDMSEDWRNECAVHKESKTER